MGDSHLYLSFVLISIGIIIVPGPNVLVIVATSVHCGTVRGLQAVAGTTTAMAIQLLVAVMGTGLFIQGLATGLEILKWLGVVYLLYVAIQYFRRMHGDCNSDAELSAMATFRRGFVTSLTNPKTLFFFAAFLPQFVSPGEDHFKQLSLLSVTFLVLAAILDAGYAMLSAKLQFLFRRNKGYRWQNATSGLLYLCAGLYLAFRKGNGAAN